MKLSARLSTLAALALAASLAACQTKDAGPGAATGQSVPVAIVSQTAGDDAGLKQPELMLVTSRAQLDNLTGVELSKLQVNFDRESLVVLAVGEKPTGGYWARINGVQRLGNDLYVQATVNRPSLEQQVSQGVTHPYAAAVITRQVGVTNVNSEIESVTGQDSAQEAPAPADAAPSDAATPQPEAPAM